MGENEAACRERLFLKLALALWGAVALAALGAVLLFAGCGGAPLQGSIAGHELSSAETAAFERVTTDEVSAVGVVLAEVSYSCEELRTLLDGEGDPVALDNARQVAFISLQVVALPGEEPPGRGTYSIVEDLTGLAPGAPVALAQLRLLQGSGYGVVAQLSGDEGEVRLGAAGGATLAGSFRFETPEGPVSGDFEAEDCGALGGALVKARP